MISMRTWASLSLALGMVAVHPLSAGDQCSACKTKSGQSCQEETSCPECGHSACSSCKSKDWRKWHTDFCWPEQYARESERRVNAPLGAQLVAGTRLESTIWEHYWDPKKPTELNEAGKSRLSYLSRRRPYVVPNLEMQATFNPEIDQARITALQTYASSVSIQPTNWNVVLVNRGTPIGLFGLEGPKAIDKMIGIAGQPPRYEPQIKQRFFSTGGGEE